MPTVAKTTLWIFITLTIMFSAIDVRAGRVYSDEAHFGDLDSAISRFTWRWPQLFFGAYLASNGLAFLILSANTDDWWQSLWLELGGALLLAAIVNFIIETQPPAPPKPPEP